MIAKNADLSLVTSREDVFGLKMANLWTGGSHCHRGLLQAVTYEKIRVNIKRYRFSGEYFSFEYM